MKTHIILLFAVSLLAACVMENENVAVNPATPSITTELVMEFSPATPSAALFTEKCAMCHRHNGMGTGLLARRMPQDQALLENRTDLTSGLIQAAVRQGIGTMPRISRAEVSDAQLQDIERHLIRPPAAAHHGGTG